MTAEERLLKWKQIRMKKIMKLFALFASKLGESILKEQGYNVDYKINGIPLAKIIKMNAIDLKQQLELALDEQRYEDACLLRDRIKQLQSNNKLI